MGRCLWISGDPPRLDDACGRPAYGRLAYCLAHAHRCYREEFAQAHLPIPDEWLLEDMKVGKHKATTSLKLLRRANAPRPDPFKFVFGKGEGGEKPKRPVPGESTRFKRSGNKDARSRLPAPGTQAAKIVNLVLVGRRDGEIAQMLSISQGYVRSLRSKYGEPIRAELEKRND